MKEKLLKQNVILYTILQNVSLLYAGYELGEANLAYRFPYEVFIVPAFYLLLMAVAVTQRKNPVMGTVKSYSATAIVTLIVSGVLWIVRLIAHVNGNLAGDDPQITAFIYPGALFIGSLLIAVNYFRCAVIIWKEDRDLWEEPDGGKKPSFLSAMVEGVSMKKVVSSIVALTVALSAFFWYSDKHEPNVVELTKENVWEYVVIDYISDYVRAEKEDALRCSISGALSHAVYEDVVLVFQVQRYPNDKGEALRYDVEVTLNAAGEAELEIGYSGLPYILNGKGKCDCDGHAELYWHNRDLQLKSVSGKVIYNP